MEHHFILLERVVYLEPLPTHHLVVCAQPSSGCSNSSRGRALKGPVTQQSLLTCLIRIRFGDFSSAYFTVSAFDCAFTPLRGASEPIPRFLSGEDCARGISVSPFYRFRNHRIGQHRFARTSGVCGRPAALSISVMTLRA